MKYKNKEKKRITTKKKKYTRRRKLKYKCVHAQSSIRNFLFEEQNEHGAMNNVVKELPCYQLQFSYASNINIVNNVPRIIEVIFTMFTTDLELYNKYTVGQEYDELPK